MTSAAGTTFASHVFISWLPESLRCGYDAVLFQQVLSSLFLIYGDITPPMRSPGTHLNNISPHQQLIILCIVFGVGWLMRHGGLDVWTIYGRLCFSFRFSMSPFPFFQNASCDGPWFFFGTVLIHGRHSERHLLFLVLALYCMTLNFGHVGVGKDFWLV